MIWMELGMGDMDSRWVIWVGWGYGCAVADTDGDEVMNMDAGGGYGIFFEMRGG